MPTCYECGLYGTTKELDAHKCIMDIPHPDDIIDGINSMLTFDYDRCISAEEDARYDRMDQKLVHNYALQSHNNDLNFEEFLSEHQKYFDHITTRELRGDLDE